MITPTQYDDFALRLHSRNVIRLPRNMMKYKAEELAFSLSGEINLVVALSVHDDFLLPFLSTGWLVDVRVRKFIDVFHFERSYQDEFFSTRKRISLCNELRGKIFEAGVRGSRICGPEKETMFRVYDCIKASEMVGLYEGGIYHDFNGKRHTDDFRYIDDQFGRLFNHLNANEDYDAGQRKLYALFSGFTLNRALVYVGSSPGSGWLNAATELGFTSDIISLDPRPLDASALSNAVKSGVKVHHVNALITGSRDLNRILSQFDVDEFDLMWDVRGDYVDDEQYDAMVRMEINSLNDILTNVRFSRANIKFSPRWGSLYLINDWARFF